jgi:hypothetical protein
MDYIPVAQMSCNNEAMLLAMSALTREAMPSSSSNDVGCSFLA